jgi:preflagellin peptidase FlaK
LLTLAVNAGFALVISFLIFFTNMWTAGDAKAFFLFVLMVPLGYYSRLYSSYFWGFTILMNIFAVAIIYIILDTGYNFIKRRKQPAKIILTSNLIIFAVIKFLFVLVSSALFNFIIHEYFMILYQKNAALFQLLFFVLIVALLRELRESKYLLIVSAAQVLFLTIEYFIYKDVYILAYTIDLKIIIVVLLIILLRYLSSAYDWNAVSADQLKEGMVLSLNSFITINILKPNTIAKYGAKLTQQEIDKIMRLKKNDDITYISVMRKIPFAPIIFSGVLLQILTKGYILQLPIKL